MDVTLFLAQLWGPALIAVGLGLFISRSYYMRLYRDIEKEPLAMLTFSMLAITAGVTQIIFHNTWNTFLQGLISFLGWATFVKGAAFAIAPQWVDKTSQFAAKSGLAMVSGVLVLACGTYLCYVGYLA